jgi:hypothetical protein
MSASTAAISTAERISAWARDERMRLTGRIPSDPRQIRSQTKQADVLLKIENYANKIKAHLESEAQVRSVAWQRAKKMNAGEAMIDRAIRSVRR